MAPEIKAICEKHGVPYVQENVLMRVWRTVQAHILKKSCIVKLRSLCAKALRFQNGH